LIDEEDGMPAPGPVGLDAAVAIDPGAHFRAWAARHRFLGCAALAALGSVAAAPDARAEAGWTDYALVTELTPTIHQRYEVTIAVQQNPSGCREKQVFFQDYSAKGSEQMYLALLESVSAGKRVRVFVTGECGVNGFSRISAVGLRSQ
jgi:hypothetical protein